MNYPEREQYKYIRLRNNFFSNNEVKLTKLQQKFYDKLLQLIIEDEELTYFITSRNSGKSVLFDKIEYDIDKNEYINIINIRRLKLNKLNGKNN